MLRTFTVEADPTPLFQELHEVAERALDSVLAVLRDGTTPEEVQEAASVIEAAGFTTIDDLLHGFGGGYLPPVLGSRSRDHDPRRGQADLRAGMTVVIQPNVVTPDHRAGVPVRRAGAGHPAPAWGTAAHRAARDAPGRLTRRAQATACQTSATAAADRLASTMWENVAAGIRRDSRAPSGSIRATGMIARSPSTSRVAV